MIIDTHTYKPSLVLLNPLHESSVEKTSLEENQVQGFLATLFDSCLLVLKEQPGLDLKQEDFLTCIKTYLNTRVPLSRKEILYLKELIQSSKQLDFNPIPVVGNKLKIFAGYIINAVKKVLMQKLHGLGQRVSSGKEYEFLNRPSSPEKNNDKTPQEITAQVIEAFKDPNFEKILKERFEKALSSDSKEIFFNVKVIYDALLAFNKGKLPVLDGHQKCLRTYKLGEGPFKADLIDYTTEKNKNEIDQEVSGSKAHYYYHTIDLNKAQALYAIQYIILSNHILPTSVSQMIIQFFHHLDIEISEHNNPPVLSKKELKVINAKIDNSINKNRIESLTDKEMGGLRLLAQIIFLKFEIPSLVYNKESDSGLSLMIFNLNTFKMLLKCYFGKEAVLPLVRLGKITPEDIKNALYDNQRPLQMILPDTDFTKNPHDFDCYPFWVSFHDMAHAWQCSLLSKEPIKALIDLHTQKYGFTKNDIQHTMSKIIWRLVDMDIRLGYQRMMHEKNHHNLTSDQIKEYSILRLYAILLFLSDDKMINLNTSAENINSVPDNDFLFLFYVIKNEENFKKMNWFKYLLDDDLIKCVDKKHSLFNKYREYREYLDIKQQMQSLMEKNSDDNIIQIITRYKLDEVNNSLLNLLFEKLDFHEIVYWSKNNGIYFCKDKRKTLIAGTNIKYTENDGKKILANLCVLAIDQVDQLEDSGLIIRQLLQFAKEDKDNFRFFLDHAAKMFFKSVVSRSDYKNYTDKKLQSDYMNYTDEKLQSDYMNYTDEKLQGDLKREKLINGLSPFFMSDSPLGKSLNQQWNEIIKKTNITQPTKVVVSIVNISNKIV
jgi:hypothetical protein